jgi:hypothetical protein
VSTKKKVPADLFKSQLGFRNAPWTYLYHHSVGGFLVETVAGTNPTQRKEFRSSSSSIKKVFVGKNRELSKKKKLCAVFIKQIL